jgi:sensor domain CHASE-containing protein
MPGLNGRLTILVRDLVDFPHPVVDDRFGGVVPGVLQVVTKQLLREYG